VGIGTSNPNAILHIADAAHPAQITLGVNAGAGGEASKIDASFIFVLI